jgi:vitamin K-dependent gamma-carboxylase
LGAPVIQPVLNEDSSVNVKRLWLSRLAVLYIGFHLVWPFRHLMYSGDASWHEQGHLFSWRMMLRVKEVALGYALEDPKTGLVANVNHKQFLAIEQSDRFAKDPRLIVQFAEFLAQHFEKQLGHRPIVHAVAVASLNGRTPQLLVDPNLDLASVEINRPDSYIVPLTEELKQPIWTEPPDQWGSKVKLPPIEFLEKMKKRKEAKPE